MGGGGGGEWSHVRCSRESKPTIIGGLEARNRCELWANEYLFKDLNDSLKIHFG